MGILPDGELRLCRSSHGWLLPPGLHASHLVTRLMCCALVERKNNPLGDFLLADSIRSVDGFEEEAALCVSRVKFLPARHSFHGCLLSVEAVLVSWLLKGKRPLFDELSGGRQIEKTQISGGAITEQLQLTHSIHKAEHQDTDNHILQQAPKKIIKIIVLTSVSALNTLHPLHPPNSQRQHRGLNYQKPERIPSSSLRPKPA